MLTWEGLRLPKWFFGARTRRGRAPVSGQPRDSKAVVWECGPSRSRVVVRGSEHDSGRACGKAVTGSFGVRVVPNTTTTKGLTSVSTHLHHASSRGRGEEKESPCVAVLGPAVNAVMRGFPERESSHDGLMGTQRPSCVLRFGWTSRERRAATTIDWATSTRNVAASMRASGTMTWPKPTISPPALDVDEDTPQVILPGFSGDLCHKQISFQSPFLKRS